MNPRITNPYLSGLGTGQLAPGYLFGSQPIQAQPMPVRGAPMSSPVSGALPARPGFPVQGGMPPVRAVGPMPARPIPQNNLVNYGNMGGMLRSPMVR